MLDRKRVASLGRGLSALMDEAATPTLTTTTLPVANIIANATQPRRRFDGVAMDELVASVRVRGVLQPILVRPIADRRFEIVAGERRWRAAAAAGLHEMPVVIRDLDDAAAFEIALVENIQRADLNPVEEAEGYRRLLVDFGHTQEGLAKIVGKSRSHVANLLRILDLPTEILDQVTLGAIGLGHAKVLVAAHDPVGLALRVIKEGLSVRQVETLVREAQPAKRQRARAPHDADLLALQARLGEALGMTVTVATTQPPHGTLTVAFSTLDQLDFLCCLLETGHASLMPRDGRSPLT